MPYYSNMPSRSGLQRYLNSLNRGRSRTRSRRRGRRSHSSKSLRISRPISKIGTGYMKVKQKVALQIDLPPLVTETAQNFVFSIDQLPQVSEFTRLFDSYRINSIMITGMPLTNGSLTTNPAYKILSAVDLDDSTPETTASMLQRSNVKIKTVTSGGGNQQVFAWKVRPRYLTQIYESATTTGYGQGARKQWLDCGDPTIPHYGIKMVFDTDPALGVEIVWQFYVTYYVEFKTIR